MFKRRGGERTFSDKRRVRRRSDANPINTHRNAISIMTISKETSIMAEDVIFALNQLQLLKVVENQYFIAAEPEVLAKLAKKHPVKKNQKLFDEKLRWTTFICDDTVKVKKDKFAISNKVGGGADGGDNFRSTHVDFNGMAT